MEIKLEKMYFELLKLKKNKMLGYFLCAEIWRKASDGASNPNPAELIACLSEPISHYWVGRMFVH